MSSIWSQATNFLQQLLFHHLYQGPAKFIYRTIQSINSHVCAFIQHVISEIRLVHAKQLGRRRRCRLCRRPVSPSSDCCRCRTLPKVQIHIRNLVNLYKMIYFDGIYWLYSIKNFCSYKFLIVSIISVLFASFTKIKLGSIE